MNMRDKIKNVSVSLYVLHIMRSNSKVFQKLSLVSSEVLDQKKSRSLKICLAEWIDPSKNFIQVEPIVIIM